ncbi:hypothetical protein [Mycobacterium senriense]|uniref:AttH domain-containing protein n=1 Tax=Mycobacterium senriense TaxID=2775496 RepID=A0ABN6IHN8_9MYCO|nr:hypothetical protein [Mycobacterium senriense]BCZ22092.1 hypothetical protein MTY59_19470 [Mycobacterium senriense]
MSHPVTAESRLLTGSNPFNVEPEMDLLHTAPADAPGWSETMFFHAWSPREKVGVFVHTGRWPSDLDLWWAQVIALLPNGELLVDRSWGRATDNRGPATGNLKVTCTTPLRSWRLHFDGAGAICDLSAMAAGPVGAGPARRLSFDLELEAAAPVWDLHGALGIDRLSWASFHHNQGFRTKGSLTAGSQRWDIDGVAIRDHSSGPRDVGQLGGLHFLLLVFPESGRVLNGLVNWRQDGRVDHRTFCTQQAGVCEVGTDVRVTGLHSVATHEPRSMDVTLQRADHSSEVLKATWLHGYSLTYLQPNENINGVDVVTQPDPLVVTQSTVRVVAPDGEVGYGVIERDYRPSALPSTEER